MNFNERLLELRKSKGLSQDELGERLGVSRQTVSKWELAQSYPDFQRLVLLSDYFGLTLDELVKGINVQEVRDKNLADEHITEIYDDIKNAKSVVSTIFNGLAIFGGISIVILFVIIFVLR
ncbi:helix-turn-helix domain-containing protein [Bacilliculturomica massiliensis]|uniref:helix-turn-helix domain-containing protein n=1 Tax=Bacilliculturomica massiliensis TaxID=1917867 RepID=UPI001031ED55|nr:helix-turn-helix transcriptional regulator [Bacilliculturomica massiliensis]